MADDEPMTRDKPNDNTPKYSFGLRSPRRSQTRKRVIVPRESSYTPVPMISQTLVESL
jgi:CRP-like cAMP-binding protein